MSSVNTTGAGMAQWLSIYLPPMWPGFDSRTWRHIWVEFVVGSRPCSERFPSGYSSFPLSSKTNISKFKFDLESEGHKFISLGLLCATLVKQRLFNGNGIYIPHFLYVYIQMRFTFNHPTHES